MRSVSTNYSRNLQQKVSCFFPYIFVFDCFELASWIANGERSRRSGLVKQATAIKNSGKCTEKIAIWKRWVVSTIVLPKSVLRKRSRCFWEARSNVKGKHAPTQTDNQRQKYMKKTLTFCCGFLAVIGRYGSHLMIVMVFLTQNNF